MGALKVRDTAPTAVPACATAGPTARMTASVVARTGTASIADAPRSMQPGRVIRDMRVSFDGSGCGRPTRQRGTPTRREPAREVGLRLHGSADWLRGPGAEVLRGRRAGHLPERERLVED